MRNAEQRRRIGRAEPVELEMQAGPARARGAVAAADDRRVQAVVAVAPHMEEAGAPRAAEPLVAVARVVRGADGLHVERQHPRRVRPIDERVDAPGREPFDQRRDREDHPGGAGDVVEHGQARARRDAFEHGIDDRVCVRHGRRHDRRHHPRAGLARHEIEQVRARKVGVAGREDFIARRERTRTQHRAQRRRDVGQQGQIRRIGRNQPGQRLPRLVEQARELAQDERGGLALDARAQRVLLFEHLGRTGAQHAVVEARHARIEQEAASERLGTVFEFPLGMHSGLHLNTDRNADRTANRTAIGPALANPAAPR